ncbi:MAG: phosphorylase [Pseudomonadales bacterium]|nr:phosphorylase [Pseudomonadales bacterium]
MIARATERAITAGGLRPIETRVERCRDEGIDWIIRVVEQLADKPVVGHTATSAASAPRKSPWMPPEEDLLVTELGESHLVVLNKFPVIEQHGLIVTRDYEDQSESLTASDFAALQMAMRDWPDPGALAFYNGGRIAGASQAHKHLQIVPLPLSGDAEDSLLVLDPSRDTLPFEYRAIGLDGRETAAPEMLSRYEELRRELGISPGNPYNLLLTREWMMMVPRSREHFETISVNSLGFAGCLLARNDAELQLICDAGPGAVLRGVT